MLDKVEALSLVRAAAKKATAPEADRVVLECIEALPSKLASSGRINLRGIVQEKNYKLLQSDKEGAFVVVHPDQYRLLSDKAFSENFKAAEEFLPSKAKKVAVEEEDNGRIEFLDVLVERTPTGLNTSVYMKPTHINT
ncbi:hypothetical protein HPB52_022767 [Rhipicephalus sanguineus]|uniref:Uncharacterized protein n=1 Tax=Rhipicephalus sanguineus TaxID=34632 RepID=A0A9D4SQB3_RHISA|nr:hypothetical protein HPB52_022767 [Rhipicephalus sanguineus]